MNGSLLLDGIVRISSPFGWRIDPFTKEPTFHSGTDYVTSTTHAPIHAPFDGKVIKKGIDKYGALFVYIRFGDYVGLAYHCSSISVAAGQNIQKGQIIAYTGSTGRSTGEHLHWGWIIYDKFALNYYGANYVDWEEEVVTEQEIKKIIKTELEAKGSVPSPEFTELWSTAVKLGVTDGTNAKGYATREEVIAMISRNTLL